MVSIINKDVPASGTVVSVRVMADLEETGIELECLGGVESVFGGLGCLGGVTTAGVELSCLGDVATADFRGVEVACLGGVVLDLDVLRLSCFLHHLFYLHRMVRRRNKYVEKCYKLGRKPIWPHKKTK